MHDGSSYALLTSLWVRGQSRQDPNRHCTNTNSGREANAAPRSDRVSKGGLPFKYLGVPVTFQRLNKEDNQILVDKITASISASSVQKLSGAGKIQLINSVLLIYILEADFHPTKECTGQSQSDKQVVCNSWSDKKRGSSDCLGYNISQKRRDGH